MHVVLFGPPGSGKGSQAKQLVNYGYIHFSPGEILRHHIKQGTGLGKQLEEIVKTGQLVPDYVVDNFFLDVLKNNKPVVFDGYPRTVEQLSNFSNYVSKGQAIVINLVVPEETLIQRMLNRAALEGRSDDTPESIRKRLENYQSITAPVLDGFKKLDFSIQDFDGTRTIEETFAEIKKLLNLV
ncbi:MAG: nucleoside monophosphate kinase [Deltaproteobacteria bacterium]|nr:nucleoside monophosphate kinase [Deltaproteobacteria bacterium]